MQRGHRAFFDATAEAVAHDEVEAAAVDGVDEAGGVAEVVAHVGVAHDDDGGAGVFDGAHQRRAVAADVDVDVDVRGYGGAGDVLAAVCGAVVADDDLAVDAGAGEHRSRLGDAGADGLCFVQTGHHDAEGGRFR